MTDLLFKEEAFAIAGAAMEVHRVVGAGFLEEVYQESMELEFELRGVPFERQKRLRIRYKERWLKKEYVADFVCHASIIVELKALAQWSGKEEAQVLNYLRATGLRLALLLNFGNPKNWNGSALSFNRLVYSCQFVSIRGSFTETPLCQLKS